jgi:hypothetical protein
MAELVTIKKIKTASGEHDIDARYWGGHEFSEITDALHGVVDTFVINSTKVSTSGYNDIFTNVSTTMTIAKTKLDTLVDKKSSDGYKVGDIVLLEGTGAFDRWVSNVTSENISLTILETQVATHHHKISVTGTTPALTSVASTTTTALAKAGTAKTVVTGVSGAHKVLTGVTYSGTGSHNIALSTATSDEEGSVGHTHKVTLPTLVSQTANAYTTLTSGTYTPHTHTTTSVAGKIKASETITYVTSAKTTQSFVTEITNSEEDTGTALTATGAVATTTSNVGTTVLTTSSGAHTHNVSVATDGAVVTSVSLAAKVVTSVSYNAPTSSTVASWTCSVNSSGVLSFTPTMGDRVTSVGLNAPRTDQSSSSGNVTLSGSAESAGAHRHGFSHTHSITAHSHTYSKATASGLVKGITELSTSSFDIHSHNNDVKVFSGTTNSTAIVYLKCDASSVGTTNVVRNLKTNVSVNSGNAYLKVTGGFTLPTLNATSVSLSTMLSTSSITPAVTAASTEQAIKSITFNSANFISSISEQKTGPNEGGI